MAYETAQYVVVDGAGRLSFVYYLLLLVLVVSNATYLVVVGNAHIVVDAAEPLGHFFARLDEPEQALNSSGLAYCPGSATGLYARTNVTSAGCRIQDEMTLVESAGKRIFVRTAWYSTLQTRECATHATHCENATDVWKRAQGTTVASYDVMPEYFALQLEHSLGPSQIYGNKFSGDAKGFHGTLRCGPLGAQVAVQAYPPATKFDQMSVRDLLKCTGLDSLDNRSDYVDEKVKESTFRQSGVALDLKIHYTNRHTASGELEYIYTVSRTPATRVRKIVTQEHANGNIPRSVTRDASNHTPVLASLVAVIWMLRHSFVF